MNKQQAKQYNEQLQTAMQTLSELHDTLTVASAAPSNGITQDYVLMMLNKELHTLNTLYENVSNDNIEFRFADFQKVASDLIKQNKKKRATESTHFAIAQYFENVNQQAVHLAASEAWSIYKQRNSYESYLQFMRECKEDKVLSIV